MSKQPMRNYVCFDCNRWQGFDILLPGMGVCTERQSEHYLHVVMAAHPSCHQCVPTPDAYDRFRELEKVP